MKKLLLIPLVMVLVSSLILSGCAAPEEEVTPSPGEVTPAPPPEEEVALAPVPPPEKYGGYIKVRYNKEPINIGFPKGMIGACHHYASAVLERILTPGEEDTIEPFLATSWELSPDRKSYTFKLREGVKFHDGTEFTATTVARNLDILIKSRIPIIVGVESVDVIDHYTVRLNLSDWSNLILPDLANDRKCLMMSTVSFDKMGEEWIGINPVGTGPWKMTEFMRGIGVKYERFDDYWGGAPYLDGFEMLNIPDAMTALAAFRAGELQIVTALDAKSAAELAAEGYDITPTRGMQNILTLNSKDPESIFADKRVRQAVEYAIDKEKICEALGYGYMIPVYEVVHSGPHHPDKVLRKYDPDKARQLLAEAGYPDGFKTKIIQPIFAERDFPVAIQGELAKVGIDVELAFYERARFMQYRLQGGLESNLLGEPRPPGSSPLGGASTHLPSTSEFYVECARPPGLEDLLQQALVELDPDKLNKMLADLDKLGYDYAMFIPLWQTETVGAASSSLKGHKPFPWGSPAYDISKAWLSEK